MREASHTTVRSLIDRHFAARGSLAAELRLREHLPGCAACRRYYERHLLLAGLDPAAPTPEERLAVGLGLRRPRPRRGAGFAAALAAACLILLTAGLLLRLDPGEVALLASRGDSAMEGQFTSRGGAGHPAELLIYRLGPDRAPALASNALDAEDELAFAYRNPAGHKRLLVFAVDEHGSVYWYFPAWRHASTNPQAVLIAEGSALRELPEAVRQPIGGRRLRVVGVFTDEPLGVREVEARLQRAGWDPDAVSFGAAHRVTARFTVRHKEGGR